MHTIKLEIHNRPAAVERVLQIVRYRKFELHSLIVECQDSQMMTIVMQVNAPQPINILTSQLNKLYDLTRIDEQQTTMPLAASA